MTRRANLWGQRSKIVKGKEKKETGQRGTCAPRCFICSGCRGRITSLRGGCPALLPKGGIQSLPPRPFCMRMRGLLGLGSTAGGVRPLRPLSCRQSRPPPLLSHRETSLLAGRKDGQLPSSSAHSCAWLPTSTMAERGLGLLLDLREASCRRRVGRVLPYPVTPAHTRPDAPLAIATSFTCSLHHHPAQITPTQGTGDHGEAAPRAFTSHSPQPGALGRKARETHSSSWYLQSKAGGRCLLGASVTPSAGDSGHCRLPSFAKVGRTGAALPAQPRPTGAGNGWCQPDISARSRQGTIIIVAIKS